MVLAVVASLGAALAASGLYVQVRHWRRRRARHRARWWG